MPRCMRGVKANVYEITKSRLPGRHYFPAFRRRWEVAVVRLGRKPVIVSPKDAFSSAASQLHIKF